MSSTVTSRGARRRAPSLPPEERKKQLLECAIRVFARRGIGSARHAEIAAEAGVAVPTVFSYFPTRRELVRSVLMEVDRFLVDLVQRTTEATSGSGTKLTAILRSFADCVETRPDYIKVWLNWSTSVQSETWAMYEDFQRRILRSFERIVCEGQASGELDRDVDPEAAAYLVVGSGQMIAQMKLTKSDPERIQRFLETVVHGALYQR